jgi:hypothetical protein
MMVGMSAVRYADFINLNYSSYTVKILLVRLLILIE